MAALALSEVDLGSQSIGMSPLTTFQQFVNDRLAAAARDIFGMYELTVSGLQDEVDRQRQLLDVALKPARQARDFNAAFDPPQQQEWSSTLQYQEPDPPHVGGEEVEKKEDVSKLAFNIVGVRSEGEAAEPSQLPHIKVEEDDGGESATCSLSHSDHQSSLYSESETSHVGDWGGIGYNLPDTNTSPFSDNRDDGKSLNCSEIEGPHAHDSGLTQDLGDGNNYFSCPVCGKVFTSKAHYEIHMRIHTGEKPFCCTKCGKCFNQRENMKRHMRTHTGERPFNCSVCGKSFTDSGDLRKHMRMHVPEKSFGCSLCGKQFKQAPLLKAHLRRHTEEKRFECPMCGKCFRERGNMKIHMRTHTGEKPFSCSECGKQFTQKSNLKTHLKVHLRNDSMLSAAGSSNLFLGHIDDSHCYTDS